MKKSWQIQVHSGNRYKHNAIKQRRGLPIEVLIDGEECILIPLTQGKETIVSKDSFSHISEDVWMFTCGYAARNGRKSIGEPKIVWLHRLIANTPDGFDTDHINGNKLDNRICNLRAVTRSQNNINKRPNRNSESGHPGVSRFHNNGKKTNRWTVRISVNKKPKYLGVFDDLQKAIEVRKRAEKEFYGNFSPRV